MMKTTLFIFLFVLSPLLALGQTATSFEFIKAANEIPQGLIAAGYKRIGNLNLVKFTKALETVQVVESEWVETPQEDGRKRVFARWERKADGARIIINKTMWDNVNAEYKAEYKAALGLHEILGAAGYNDESYSISTSLWLLHENSKRDFLEDFERKYVEKRVKERVEQNSGGVIGVGGGGDLIGPMVKIFLIADKIADYQKVRTVENREQIIKLYQATEMVSVEGKWTIQP